MICWLFMLSCVLRKINILTVSKTNNKRVLFSVKYLPVTVNLSKNKIFAKYTCHCGGYVYIYPSRAAFYNIATGGYHIYIMKAVTSIQQNWLLGKKFNTPGFMSDDIDN